MKRICIYILLITLSSTNLKAQFPADTAYYMTNIYKLGEVVVSNSANKEVVNLRDMQKHNHTDVAVAIGILPSVSFNHAGARNEGTIYLRGFDLRSVPVFADGIPIYVPYDGYVDLARFSNSDLSKIEISKGASSVLYGANNIGGTINLVSSKPTHRFELLLRLGALSGNAYTTHVSLGSKIGKFYIQGNFTKLDKEYMVLSHDFDTTKNETDWERDNSYRNDNKASFKIAFTPNQTDEYSVNYINQYSEKGNPVYLGADPTIKLRYWQWPQWDKQSVYFISNTHIGNKSYVKTRLFMDRFINTLKSYDNNLYIDQTRPYAFTSHYNDYSYGGNFEASTEMFNKHLLKIAAHFKNDTHRENNEGEPNREFTDYTYSYGIEDVYSPIPSIKIVPGVSFNLRNSIKAEDYNSSSEEITNFPINKNSALNAQLLLDYAFNQNFDITLTAAHKTRFATMKDRYSYKMGLAIPNPELKAEQAMNLELASIMKLSDRITFEPALFYTRLFNTIQMIDNVLPGISQQQNTGGAQFWGADFAFSYQFLQNLKWSSNYSFIKRENISSPELKFTDVPEHKIFSYIDYSPIKNMDFVFSAGYNSYRYSTSFGTKSPEFLVFNSQISYSFAKFFRAEVGINNLLDKNYTLAEGYPQEGRNIYVSLILNIIK